MQESWLTELIHSAPNVDFTDPEEDEYNVQVLPMIGLGFKGCFQLSFWFVESASNDRFGPMMGFSMTVLIH